MASDVHVRVCLQDITKLDLEIKALTQDIRRCDGPAQAVDDLNNVVKDRLKKLRALIEELSTLAHEHNDKPTDQVAIQKEVKTHKAELASNVQSLRQANLTAQMTIDKKERDDLLTSGTALRQRVQKDKSGLARSAGHITESLMSVHKMLATEVEHSDHTKTTLVTSSKTITDTHDEMRSMSGHIHNSRKLLTKYSRRELTHKLLVFLAFVFFFATVFYIVKKRLWGS